MHRFQQYTISGIVSRGDQYGTRMGYPTANIWTDESHDSLEDGVYAGTAQLDGHTHHAMIFIGEPTTLDQRGRRIETHILDYPAQDLYGKTLAITLLSYIRPNKHFDNEKQLLQAIQQDEQTIRTFFTKI